ncbi:MAG: D-alanyl-D-alanine carboxypeptidase family protein [Neisseria sp.]|nr:D-alanyl-D-alanine carboxypeptidase family protein [Neisseria sp.]
MANPQAASAAQASQASDVQKTAANDNPQTANASGETLAQPEIQAPIYFLQDLQSGQILLQKEANKTVEPGSLVKLMSAYLVFQAIADGKLKAEQTLTPSKNAWSAEGARMFLQVGKAVSVQDLLRGMVVQSANDATIALAEGVAGSESAFVAQMNAAAKRLGMKQTQFVNATGKPVEGQISSAQDMALLVAAMWRQYPKQMEVFSEKTFKYHNIEQASGNLLLFRDTSVDGMMASHTLDGFHLISTSHRNGRKVLSIVLSAETAEQQTGENSRLLNWALQGFDTIAAYQAKEILSRVKVYAGQSKEVGVGVEEEVYLTVPHGELAQVKPVLETEQNVSAPIQAGQVLGKLKLMKNQQVLLEKNVVALRGVQEAGWLRRTWDSIYLWFSNLFA